MCFKLFRKEDKKTETKKQPKYGSYYKYGKPPVKYHVPDPKNQFSKRLLPEQGFERESLFEYSGVDEVIKRRKK